jgi:hypothetical protein
MYRGTLHYTHEARVYILLTHKMGVAIIFQQLFHTWAM